MRALLSSLVLIAALVLTAVASGHFSFAVRSLQKGVASGSQFQTAPSDVYASTVAMAVGVLTFLILTGTFVAFGDRSLITLFREEHSEDAFRGLRRLFFCLIGGVLAGMLVGKLWPG
jgi:hypothetical protein